MSTTPGAPVVHAIPAFAAVPAFDMCGPLPQGTVVLEASAGTGKTFTIAALATRYVAEGQVELSQLMLVTFGRAATQELRERVRERLVSAERGLADPAAARAGDDDLLGLLADVSDDEVAARRRRLATALAGFDAATIATTHGFCQQMLAGLGMASDTDPDATFVENIDDLIDEVVDDLYLRKFATPDAGVPAMDYTTAKTVARNALYDRQAGLVLADADSNTEAGQRYGLAVAARAEVDRRKRQRKLLDYDDLLHRLRDALVDPQHGEAARQRIRRRYAVVLVDEFQDTDPVQWDILRLTFDGHVTLVLIGDPKQAIYAFRGGDVVTYLDAASSATSTATLTRNWRSDQPLLDAFGELFQTAALGHERIVVRPVEAANPERRLTAEAPLRIRLLDRGGGKSLWVDEARARVATDVASDIARRLTVGEITPGDVAVLVRTNKQGPLVRDALADVGVPAVLTSSASVFGTPIAREWLTLLQALEAPHRAGLVRAAALTCFVGWTATQLDSRGESALDELGPRMRGWADLLARRGVAALQEEVASSTRLPARMLAGEHGERDLTDLRHVGQSLHTAAVEGQLGITALVEWLQRRITDAVGDLAEDRSRRLESDAAAVQIITVHRSKGLEFPVVYVPFAWDRWLPVTPDPLRLHDDAGHRLLDVGGPGGPEYGDRRLRHAAEESGEDLRLFYVAITRAQSSVVLHYAPSGKNTTGSALNRLLFAEFARGTEPPQLIDVPSDKAAFTLLSEVADGSNGTIAVEQVPAEQPPIRWEPPAEQVPDLAAAVFDRSLDLAWRRTSYSSLTAAVHDGASAVAEMVGSEPENPDRADEVPVQLLDGTAGAGIGTGTAGEAADGMPADEHSELRQLLSPLRDQPSGTTFGTLVHAVLEEVDTSAVDLAAELVDRCTDAVTSRYGSSVDPQALAAGLLPVLETPLGPLADDRRLRDISPADRLAEMDFEMPLAGGDRPHPGDATLADVAELLRQHLPASDPLAGYADVLDVPGLREQRLRGYLTGSLDAVLRVRDEAGRPRYLIADYKTNWLGPHDDVLSAWNYRPSAMAEAMLHAHYPLQALLYGVALHRYLAWRQPGYDPAVHLGGVLYLYVRGMCGPETPVVDGMPCGVFSWQPPATLIEKLSERLA
ncbi:MAG TPA: UvrD-helicase domain-containing protein [Frankiaceae bacterium]|nr:UvrD-helicase domain-containing protein [Frankiaceae bacterium]